jgi:hypothetical protein
VSERVAKSVRFAKVVERSGEPHVHTLWLPPDKDPELKRAQQSDRVMTVERSPGGKAHVGFVGFDPAAAKSGQLLIFPKSLKRFDGARVVGIKFDLVAQPKLAPASALKVAMKPQNPRHSRKPPAPPARKPESPSQPNGHASSDRAVIPFDDRSVDVERRERIEHARRETPPERPPTRKTPRLPTPKTRSPSPADPALVREIRAAMKELERGKSVAAYQRLERAIAES